MAEKTFNFTFAGQTHEAIILAQDLNQKPDFVFSHGAGGAGKERVLAVADALVTAGHSVLAFDHSGAGRDKENLNQSSLERRVNELRFAIGEFADKDNLAVCGSSMGGHVALKMLEFFPVKKLVLFSPALYDAAAYSVPFGPQFSAIIRQPESWRNTNVTAPLESFHGRLLIVIGELDDVIPPGVIELLDRNSPNASAKEIMRVPGCPHLIQRWLMEHETERRLVGAKIVEYCS